MANRAGRVTAGRARRALRSALRGAAALACLHACTSEVAEARSLKETLLATFPPGPPREDAAGIAEVFARTVATSFPTTGSSAPYAYRFDPATDAYERLRIPLGPVFSERARTVGPGKLDLGVNYLFLRYDSIDGRDLDNLVSNDPNGPGPSLGFRVGDVVIPAQAIARIDLEAQIVGFSATYGVLPDLDVSLLVPLVRTFLRASTSTTVPDPRAPIPGLEPFSSDRLDREDATGVGDVLLRLKYLLPFAREVSDLAAGLSLSAPSGEQDDFQGTGDTLLGFSLYASRSYAERVEPHLNLGFVLDADDPDRSQVRYSLGADLRVLDWLTLNGDFLGRSDVAEADPVETPVFVQIERTDVFHFSTGWKVAPFRGTAAFFNVLLPLNDEGLRADVIYAAGIEVVF